jgi:hypothetical protein
MPPRHAGESTDQAVDRTNKSLLRGVIIIGVLILAAVVAVLVWVVGYVHSGRGISCQSNEIIRGLHSTVNALLRQVDAGRHVKFPETVPAPKACT